MKLTDGSILEDNQKASIIFPLDLEAAVGSLIFRKGELDVLCLEFFWEARQIKDACD